MYKARREYKEDWHFIFLQERDYWLDKYKHPSSKELLEIFNLTPQQGIQAKLRYHKSHKKRILTKLNDLEIAELKRDSSIVRDMIQAGTKVLNKTQTTINYLTKHLKYLNEVEKAKKNNTPPPVKQFTEYDKEHIKKNTPIELVMGRSPDAIGHGVKKYKCPYHNEKTPSFVWDENKKLFNCFGCGKGGDIITLYQHMNNTNFIETLKSLS